jgi:hypothetical protein
LLPLVGFRVPLPKARRGMKTASEPSRVFIFLTTKEGARFLKIDTW